jgi:circadian clock protein KaiB
MDEHAFDRLVIERGRDKYVLRLYVTGMTPRSTEAVAAVTDVCQALLAGRYDLEVVDLYQDPVRAKDAQVIAAPTLVRESPPPLRRLIGDLSDPERIRRGLNLPPDETDSG